MPHISYPVNDNEARLARQLVEMQQRLQEYERAFRACVEALEMVSDAMRQSSDSGEPIVFLTREKRQIDAALALAQAADSPTTEAEA